MLKNVILLLSLAANVILGAVASHYWLRSRATQLGLSSDSEALRSVAGAALLPSVRIEFRVAEEQPIAGLTPVPHEPGSPSTVYVRPEIIVSNSDIESANATKDDFGRPAVRLTLSEDGQKKLNAAATANPMKRVAILVDGKAILAPVMQGPVADRTLTITGAITAQEAERIALAFSRK